MSEDEFDVPDESWWCEGCRHLIWAPDRNTKIDHLLDVHVDELKSGRLKLVTDGSVDG